MSSFFLLCGISLLAGLIDSVVGGGGLIQLPGLLMVLPALPPAVIFGTNKLASICGTSVAMLQYSRRVRFNWRLLLPAGIAALGFSWLGSKAVSQINSDALKPVILGLLAIVAVYTFLHKDFGDQHQPRLDPQQTQLAGVGIGSGLGFYDGFFGPGTGSFLIFLFIRIFGFDFLRASAHAKAINFCTNLASVVYFASTDQVLYGVALPMGLCNICGSVLGTQLAMLKGNQFIRSFFLLVVVFIWGALIIRWYGSG